MPNDADIKIGLTEREFDEGFERVERRLRDAQGRLVAISAQMGRAADGVSDRIAEIGRRLDRLSVPVRLKALGDFFQSLGERIGKVGGALADLGRTLTIALTVPLVAAGAAAFKYSADFEAAFNKVKAKSGANAQELQKLEAQALKLGKETKFSATQVADAQSELAAAGQKSAQVMASISPVLSLAVAGQLELARSAQITSDTLSQFGFAADQSGRVADVLVKAADSSSISVEQLGLTFKYIGPIAKATGQSFEEMAAAAALLGNAGIKGEQAGTALRGAFSALLDPSKEAAKTLDKLQIQYKTAAGGITPLNEILTQLQKSGATTTDIIKIFGQEAGVGMVALLANGGKALADLTKEFESAAGQSDRTAKILGSGTIGKIEELKGSAETLAIVLGKAFQPLSNLALDGITAAVNSLTELAEKFQRLPESVRTGIGVILAFVAAIGPVVAVVGAVVVGIGSVITAFGTISAAIAPVVAEVGLFVAIAGGVGPALAAIGTAAAPVIGVIAAVVAAAVALYAAWETNFGGIRDIALHVWESVKSTTAEALDFINGYFQSAGAEAVAWWNENWPYIQAIVEAVSFGVKAVLTLLLGSIRALWMVYGSDIIDIVKGVWDVIAGVIGGALRLIGSIISVALRLLTGDFDGAWKAIVKGFLGLSASVVRIMQGVGNIVIGILNPILKTVNGVINGISQMLGLSFRVNREFSSLNLTRDETAGIQQRNIEANRQAIERNRLANLQKNAAVDLSKPLIGGGPTRIDFNRDGRSEPAVAEYRGKLASPGEVARNVGAGGGRGGGGRAAESADVQLLRQLSDETARLTDKTKEQEVALKLQEKAFSGVSEKRKREIILAAQQFDTRKKEVDGEKRADKLLEETRKAQIPDTKETFLDKVNALIRDQNLILNENTRKTLENEAAKADARKQVADQEEAFKKVSDDLEKENRELSIQIALIGVRTEAEKLAIRQRLEGLPKLPDGRELTPDQEATLKLGRQIQVQQTADLEARRAYQEKLDELRKKEEESLKRRAEQYKAIADQSVLNQQKVNDGLLEFFSRQKGFTEAVLDAQIGIVERAYSVIDRSLDKLTKRFGALGDIIKGFLSTLIKASLNKIFLRLFGLDQGASGGAQAGFGSIFGGAGVPAAGSTGGGFGAALGGLFGGQSGGFSSPGFAGGQTLTQQTQQAGLLSNVFGGGGAGGSRGGLLGGLFGGGASRSGFDFAALGRAGFDVSGLPGAGGAAGALGGFGGVVGGLAPLLGGAIGQRIGGTLGQFGGLALGAFGAASAGLLGSGAIAGLLSNPFTAVAGVGLLAGGFLFGRARQRKADEKSRNAIQVDATKRLDEILAQLRSRQLDGDSAIAQSKQVFDEAEKAFSAIKTRKVRENAFRDYIPDLKKMLDLIKTEAGKRKAEQERFTVLQSATEFANGGLIDAVMRFPRFGEGGSMSPFRGLLRGGRGWPADDLLGLAPGGLVRLSGNEAVLNPPQIAALGGTPAMRRAGVPGFADGGLIAQPSAPAASGADAITVNVYLQCNVEPSEVVVKGVRTERGGRAVTAAVQANVRKG